MMVLLKVVHGLLRVCQGASRAATRDGDSDFKDVVAWVWYGMVTAEEMV